MTQRALTFGEIIDRGILQEINRRFLHPRGLSLRFFSSQDPEEMRQVRGHPSGWFDVVETDDLEGFVFDGDTALTESDARRARLLDNHYRMIERWLALGFYEQPLPGEEKHFTGFVL